MYLTNRNQTVLGFLDEFCEQHGIEPTYNTRNQYPRIEISKRDDLATILELVRPFLIAKHEPVEILLEDLIPELKAGKQSSEEGFYELMGIVDKYRELSYKDDAKYDQAYFRDEWDM